MIPKQKWLLSTVYFLMIFCFAAWSKVLLLDEHSDAIKLKFEIPHYEIGSKIIDGKRYTLITDPSEPPTCDKGFPEVPYYTQSILTDNNAAKDVEIIHIKFIELKIPRLVPSRGLIKRNQDPDTIPYTFGKIYAQNSWYPEKNVTITKPFIFRDVRGATVTFNPFQYNAALGILRVAEEIVVSISSRGIASTGKPILTPKITSSAFSSIYKEMFINYPIHRSSSYIPDGDKMIIIAADKYKDKLDEFVEWKTRKGIKTTVYSYPSKTGSGVKSIQNFIKKIYHEQKITYVLLVGNGKDIPGNNVTYDPPSNPVFPGFPNFPFLSKGNSNRSQSDPPYSLVTDDIYPEVFIGRFCVDNNKQLETIIAKSISYEKNPDIDGTWYGNSLLNGSKYKQVSNKADWEWILEFADSLKKGGYKLTDIFSENGVGNLTPGTAKTTSEAINKGIGWFNYLGHGTETTQMGPKFTTSDISKLSNHGMYGVCISAACLNGKYDNRHNYECVGQAWTVAGSPDQGKGGIVFLGASIETDWVPPIYGMQGMMKIIAQRGEFLSVGNIVNNGLVFLLNKYRSDRSNTFATWNYFGDPSIYLRFAAPTPLKIDHPAALNEGTHEFNIKAPDNIIICVYGKSQNIWQTEKSEGGTAKFTIEVKNSADSIYVTGNGKNTLPYFGAINGYGGTTGITDNYMVNAEKKADILFNNAAHNVIFTFPGKYSNVSISVYSVNGRLVYSKTLTDNKINKLNWNFTDSKGQKLAKGMYQVSMIIKTENKAILKFNKTLIYSH